MVLTRSLPIHQQLLTDAGYEPIYTPPYVSELQPIEMIY